MNERIRELWDRAAESAAAYPSGQNNSWQTQVDFMDKFAELIVRECADLMNSDKDSDRHVMWNRALYETRGKILRHFGVEE